MIGDGLNNKAALFSGEVQRFVDSIITILDDREVEDNGLIEIFQNEHLKFSQNELFSYHLQSVILEYIRGFFGIFSEELNNKWKTSLSGPYVTFNEQSRNMILEHLGNSSSNTKYYIAFAQFAILRNLYKGYFEDLEWNQSWILKIIRDAIFDGVLKEKYDSIRRFGLSYIKTVFEIQGCSMGQISHCYSTLPKWKENTLPQYVQIEDSEDADAWEKFEKKKCFVGYTNSEIRSTMQRICMDMSSRYPQDNTFFRYITAALYLAKYLVKIEVNGVEYASDVITRWVESSEIEYFESTHYDLGVHLDV